MATWEQAFWESRAESGGPRRARQPGTYRRYVPDALDGVALAIDGDLSRRATAVERGIRSLNGPDADGLAGIARFLLRSEAIASSRIEGIAPSAQQVALAELGQSESVRGVSEQARLVANNLTVVRRSVTELAGSEELTLDHVVGLHRALLPEEPRHHGLRGVQNWIGGWNWNPLDADFVPPSHERVPALMADLIDYANGSAHAPLIQAALVHAQFETIHPFTDGNGRVGRALIHTVLTRRGLTSRVVLPISLVLATLSDRYVAGLTSYRHDATPASTEASLRINEWLTIFVEASAIAVEQSISVSREINDLRADFAARLSSHRKSVGLRPIPRADSAVGRLLNLLPEAPVVTARTLSTILNVSVPAASTALDELRLAGIVHPKSIDRGATAFIAREVLDLVTWTERALASTRFDTRASAPNRSAPAPP